MGRDIAAAIVVGVHKGTGWIESRC